MRLLLSVPVVLLLLSGVVAAVPSAAPSVLPSAAPSVAVAGTTALASTAAAAPQSRPWAVVDKRTASLTVYRPDGTVAGRTPVLLGIDRGDAIVPGVGERTQSGRLRPGDRTTPAGRFVSHPGFNRDGEAVIWVDYDAAFAIHRLRGGASHAARSQRLASANPARRRASAGCVVVPVAFFENVVQPLLGQGSAVVVVLPES